MSNRDIFRDEFVSNIETHNKLSYSTWKSANPSEASRYEAFRDKVISEQEATAPSMTTKYGKALVAAAKMAYMPVVSPPPPPPISGLKYARPVLNNPLILNVSANNRFFELGGRDFIVKMPSTPVNWQYGITLKDGGKGWVIGGEIKNDHLNGAVDQHYGFYVLACDHIHFERVLCHGAGLGQAIMFAPDWGVSGSATGIATFQKCRLETLHPVGAIHTDAIQSAAGPAFLGLHNVSLRSTGLNLQMQPRQYGYIGPIEWEIENVDGQHLTTATWALNKSDSNRPWWAVRQKNFYIKLAKNSYGTNWTDGTQSGWQPGGANGGALVTGDPLVIGLPPGGVEYCRKDECGIAFRE